MLELWQGKLENVNVQEPHLTPNRVLNAETNEKPFLDCIFDTNNLSAHIITLTYKCFLAAQSVHFRDKLARILSPLVLPRRKMFQ